MAYTLETLLRRIRDGLADRGEIEQARALVAEDARLPEELRSIALREDEDLEADAAGLLSVLGVDDLGALLAEAIRAEAEDVPTPQVDDGWQAVADVLREGLRAEAGVVDVAESVLRRLAVAGWAWGPVLAEAVRAEAGQVDIASSVCAALELDAPVLVAEAVRAEAGRIDVASSVCGALQLDVPVPVAEAVRAEAGRVDIAAQVVTSLELAALPDIRQAVLAEAGSIDIVASVAAALEHEAPLQLVDAVLAEAGDVDVADAVLAELGLVQARVTAPPPVVVETPRSAPVPANDARGFSWRGLALAAAALISVVGVSVMQPWSTGTGLDEKMLFAHAGEVVVEDLSYGDDVQVFQTEGDQGAVILWVDEEA